MPCCELRVSTKEELKIPPASVAEVGRVQSMYMPIHPHHKPTTQSLDANQKGEVGNSSLDALRQKLQDRDWHTRKDAVQRLGDLGSDPSRKMTPVVVPDLQRQLLKDEHWRVRCQAAKTIGLLGPSAAMQAAQALQTACLDSDNIVRAAALSAITSNGLPMPQFPGAEPKGASWRTS
mmetsp:Transcript_22057/g.42351  ORF Transcript_22057/g.42351 Transcript_22057/m.42351 type:complete len:177 (-) Transcript_22057:80-610(-)